MAKRRSLNAAKEARAFMRPVVLHYGGAINRHEKRLEKFLCRAYNAGRKDERGRANT